MLLLLSSLAPFVAGESYADACDCTDLPTDPVELSKATFDVKVRVLQSRMNLGTHVVIGPVGDPPADSGLNAQDPIFMALQQELPEGTHFTIEPSCCRVEKTCVDFICPDGYYLTSTAGCNAEECERDQCCTKEAQCTDFDCGVGHHSISNGGCSAPVCTYDKCCAAEAQCADFDCGDGHVRTSDAGCNAAECTYDKCCKPEGPVLKSSGHCSEYFQANDEAGQQECWEGARTLGLIPASAIWEQYVRDKFYDIPDDFAKKSQDLGWVQGSGSGVPQVQVDLTLNHSPRAFGCVFNWDNANRANMRYYPQNSLTPKNIQNPENPYYECSDSWVCICKS